MPPPTPTLTLQEAAERLGVHYMTMYRYVRLGLVAATKEGGAWRVAEADLERLRHPAPTPRGEAPWGERLEARMLEGDVAGAWSVVEAALASGTEPAEVYTALMAPALTRIGERWASGELGVEDEHLASAVASRLIGRLGSRFARRGRPRGTVVTVMPPGERHGFGLAMLADVLRGAGYTVLDLGPDTPVASVVAALSKVERLRGVCVGVVLESAVPAAAEMVVAVRAEVGPKVPILVGGRAVPDATTARSLGADAWAPDPVTAVSVLEGFTAPPGRG